MDFPTLESIAGGGYRLSAFWKMGLKVKDDEGQKMVPKRGCFFVIAQ